MVDIWIFCFPLANQVCKKFFIDLNSIMKLENAQANTSDKRPKKLVSDHPLRRKHSSAASFVKCPLVVKLQKWCFHKIDLHF